MRRERPRPNVALRAGPTRTAQKALVSGADAVVLDLEDSVPPERKDEAREAALAVLRDLPSERPRVWVRINALGSPWGGADLAALAGVDVDGIRLPRAQDQDEVREVAMPSTARSSSSETARGLMAAQDLAVAHPRWPGSRSARPTSPTCGWLRLAWTGLGGGWSRSRVRPASSPVQSVYTDVRDLAGLRPPRPPAGTIFFGRSVVHPQQIEPVHEVYRPTDDEIGSHRTWSTPTTAHGSVARQQP